MESLKLVQILALHKWLVIIAVAIHNSVGVLCGTTFCTCSGTAKKKHDLSSKLASKESLQYQDSSLQRHKMLISDTITSVLWYFIWFFSPFVLQAQPYLDFNYSAQLLRHLCIPNIMLEPVPNRPLDYYTCAFRMSKMEKWAPWNTNWYDHSSSEWWWWWWCLCPVSLAVTTVKTSSPTRRGTVWWVSGIPLQHVF